MSKEVTKLNIIPGCDLGTTNSAIAYVNIEGRPTIIEDVKRSGGNTTPSVVCFNPDTGEKLVGEPARSAMIRYPKYALFETKRLIGRKYGDTEIQELIKRNRFPYKIVEGKNGEACIQTGEGTKTKIYSPVEIAATILEEMKRIAEEKLGSGPGSVTRMIVTVPAYFTDSQRQATKEAGEIAGLKVERIINEPTAAALAYGIESKLEKGTIAVFDLGGGTFDISIIEIRDGLFEVRATNGDTFLGGADFDARIEEWIRQKAKVKLGIDLQNDAWNRPRVREAAIEAKHNLSSLREYLIQIPHIGMAGSSPIHFSETLTRREFEDMCKDLLMRLEKPCLKCLKDSKFKKVDEVIMVGGMTRMPAVQNQAKTIFGTEPKASINPDEAVALGAAIEGSILTGQTKDVVLVDVTPLSLGIETQGGINNFMIKRNTPIPISVDRTFTTAVDNQPAVTIRITQGESEVFESDLNKFLDQFDLTGIEVAPRGVPQIEVNFSVDSNGIIKVTARDKKTGREKTVTPTRPHLNEEEKERMVKEAQARTKEDQEFKRKVELVNRARDYCYTFEKDIKKFRENNLQDEPQFQELEKFCNDVNKAIDEKNYDSIGQLIDEKNLVRLTTIVDELTKKIPASDSDSGVDSESEENKDSENDNNKEE